MAKQEDVGVVAARDLRGIADQWFGADPTRHAALIDCAECLDKPRAKVEVVESAQESGAKVYVRGHTLGVGDEIETWFFGGRAQIKTLGPYYRDCVYDAECRLAHFKNDQGTKAALTICDDWMYNKF